MKRILPFVFALCLTFSLAACTHQQNNTTESPAAQTPPTDTSTPTPTPAPTLKYTFDEVVASKPTYYLDGGSVFQVKSQDANYYGEITVGKRSYVEGTAEDIQGTYALFVTDGSNSKLLFTFNAEGYCKTHAVKATAQNDVIMYPADMNWFNNGADSSVYKDSSTFEDINGLSLVECMFSKYSGGSGDGPFFKMLTVVISKDEAVRYAQDGTLPSCLQGLTVTGLDKIFKSPQSAAQTTGT